MSNLTFVNQVGAADGINQAGPGTFIPDTFVRWAQDVLFDRAGLIRRRAPFKNFVYGNFVQPSTNDERVVSFISTLNPIGERILGLVVTTSSSSRILFYDSNYTQTGTSTLEGTLNRDSVYDCKQANNGGMWLSFMDSYATASASNKYYQYYWYGGNGVEHTNASTVSFGTLGAGNNATYTNTINGTFDTSKLSRGMFVYVSYNPGSGTKDYYVGTISSFDASSITLTKDIVRFVFDTALTAGTTTGLTINFKNVRPYIHQHGRGLITRSSSSATVITSGSVGTEGEGHFASADLDKSPGWAIYRASDGEWIGDVDGSAAITNSSLNLTIRHTDQSTTALAAEEYVAYKYVSVPSAVIQVADSTSFAGIFNATYSGYQWFGNAGNTEDRHRIVFSAYHSSEAVDLSQDGADSIAIPGTGEMRGMASSTAGLLIFMTDRTYLLRGNYRSNFSLELLYPEGCLSSMSIVEYGGGVFWASRLGIMYYDGATVRNLTESNLGVYYTDGVKNFSVNYDRIYSFLHKDYLFINFTNFNSLYKPLRYEPVYAESITSTPAISGFAAEDWDPDFTPDDFNPANNVPIYWEPITLYKTIGEGATGKSFVWNSGVKWASTDKTYVWGPADFIEGITFAIYIPTNALTVISNFDNRGAVKVDSINGQKALMATNVISGSYAQARIIDVDSILNVDATYDSPMDDELVENVGKADENYIKGPDFYLQTKHYSVGDPILRKWFRQVFLNLYLVDGAIRMDVVDNEDNDTVDVQKKAHKNWDIFDELTYSWSELETLILPRRLSPNRSTWANVQDLGSSWYNLVDASFERRKKRISWRYPTFGVRLYQMNKYRPRNYQTTQRPHTLMMDSWDVGFKPMRQSRR